MLDGMVSLVKHGLVVVVAVVQEPFLVGPGLLPFRP